jgi:hypothetical protein
VQKQLLLVALAAGLVAAAAGLFGVLWLAGAAAAAMLLLLIVTPWMKGAQDEEATDTEETRGRP